MSSHQHGREKRRVSVREAAEKAGISILRAGNAWSLTGRRVDLVVADLADVDPARDFIRGDRPFASL